MKEDNSRYVHNLVMYIAD